MAKIKHSIETKEFLP